jgi:hypothetical protein
VATALTRRPSPAAAVIGVVTPSGGAGGGGGGATYLDALTDVSLSSPSNGQVLKYNSSQWPNQLDDTSSGGTGVDILDELTDVALSSPQSGQVVKYNGCAWVNQADAPGGGGGMDYLTDNTTSLKYSAFLAAASCNHQAAMQNAVNALYATSGSYHRVLDLEGARITLASP